MHLFLIFDKLTILNYNIISPFINHISMNVSKDNLDNGHHDDLEKFRANELFTRGRYLMFRKDH